MKGVPNNFNYKVILLETGEEKQYKSLSEISREYHLNEYKVREIYKCSTGKQKTSNCRIQPYLKRFQIYFIG